MLKEMKISQREGENFRRWFTDEDFDLFVWVDNTEEIQEFQLTYDRRDYERVLKWSKKSGYRHEAVDEGARPGKPKQTPIFVMDGVFYHKTVAEEFLESSKEMDPAIASFVISKIKAFPQINDQSGQL